MAEFDKTRQLIPLQGTCNTRDIGGYETRNGGQTLSNRLIRSDGMHALTAADKAMLRNMGLRMVLDLRRDDERAREPNLLAAEGWVDYRPVPLYQSEPHTRGYRTETILEYYQALLLSSQPTIKEVFSLLAEPENFPVLIHCSAGKDRTGLIVAMALELAGVRRETIVADYSASNDNIEPLKPKFRAAFERFTNLPPSVYERLLSSPPEAMEGVFNFLDSEYGGPATYL